MEYPGCNVRMSTREPGSDVYVLDNLMRLHCVPCNRTVRLYSIARGELIAEASRALDGDYLVTIEGDDEIAGDVVEI